MPQQHAQQHQQQQRRQPSVTEVTVKDVDISFGQMVVLLVKLAIASIPAAIILWIVFAIFGGIFIAVFGGMGALMG